MKTALWWVRRDLRLRDNAALAAALKSAERVIPVFVLDPILLGSQYVGPKRTAFLFAGLEALSRALAARGSRLIAREGPPEAALSRLLGETGAEGIFVEQDVSPYARRRDQALSARLPLRGVWGVSVLTPGQALKPDGTPYATFTSYSRAWRRDAALGAWTPRDAPAAIPAPERLDELPASPFPELPSSGARSLFDAGEDAAEERLERFLRGPVYSYADERNRLDLDATSRLSPYLRFGMLSARRAVSAAWRAIEDAPGAAARRSAEAWLNELVWREFYISILYHHPRVREGSFRSLGIEWREAPEEFQAWCEGKTGYPVVDAAMRELVATGLMHNRARMIVASFLTKHLLLDWRLGERFFMQHLVDGDPAANNGGWQWTAGTGTDGAPYFRIFNPILQGKKFDPRGDYVRRWLPELEGVEAPGIHEPRSPIVTHTKARVRALEALASGGRRADPGGTRAPASTSR